MLSYSVAWAKDCYERWEFRKGVDGFDVGVCHKGEKVRRGNDDILWKLVVSVPRLA